MGLRVRQRVSRNSLSARDCPAPAWGHKSGGGGGGGGSGGGSGGGGVVVVVVVVAAKVWVAQEAGDGRGDS